MDALREEFSERPQEESSTGVGMMNAAQKKLAEEEEEQRLWEEQRFARAVSCHVTGGYGLVVYSRESHGHICLGPGSSSQRKTGKPNGGENRKLAVWTSWQMLGTLASLKISLRWSPAVLVSTCA